MKLKVRHPKYLMLGTGQIIDEKDGKATVEFDNRTVVFLMSELEVVLPSKSEPVVFIDGEKYKPLSDVNKELENWVISETQEWKSNLELSTAATEKFGKYTKEKGVPFFNTGGFDPLFCVTKKNPGKFIKKGILIFRKATTGSGYQWEFKSRAAASYEEISICTTHALEKGKFVFVESNDKEMTFCNSQLMQSLNA